MDAAVELEIPCVLRIGEAEPLRTVVHWLFGDLDPDVEERARLAMAGATVLWSNSRAAVRRHRESGYTGRFLVLESGVDAAAAGRHPTATEREACRTRLGVRADHRLLVCAGTLWAQKGQALLVTALTRVRGDHPDLRCALLGAADRAYADGIAHFLIAHDATDTVRVLPFCDDLAPWWRAADAAVCPSETESLPAAVLEAMTFGIPVLGSRVGDVPELVEHGVTGWLCDPSDLAALAVGLATVARTPIDALRAMGAEAARRAARDHDRATSLERTVELFEAAVRGKLPSWAAEPAVTR